jgi:tetratricopeptide (TPR) repeat protein
VPGLAEAVDPAGAAPLNADLSAALLRRLQALARTEGDNPFYHWASGELRRRAGDAAAEADFARASAAARSRPVLHWLLWEAYLERNQYAEAEQELAALQEIYSHLGLVRFPQLADRLVREARRALAGKDYSKAARLVERAIDIDASGVAPQLLLATILWQWDPANAFLALRALLTGAYLAWRTTGAKQLLLGNLLANLAMAYQLALAILAVVLFLRCHRLLSHDLGHAIRLPAGGQAALTIVVLIPVVLWLGLFWAALLLFVLVAPYVGRGERVAVSAMLVALFLLPVTYRAVAHFYLLGGSPRAVLAEEAEAGARGDEVLAQVQQWAAEAPGHYIPSYYLGLVHKRRNEVGPAAEALKRAVELAPDRAAPWVALGNVLYLQEKKDAALAAYERAAAAPGNSAVAHLNAGFLYAERFQFDKSRAEFDEAFQRDPKLASLVIGARDGRRGSFLADDRLASAEVWGTLWPGQPEEDALAEELWGRKLRGVPLDALPAAAATLLGAFWIGATWGGLLGQARPCPQCGKVFCGRCQLISPEERACASCATVGSLRVGLAAPLKIQRLREAERFRERQRRAVGVLAFCLPGAGHLYLGRTLAGMALLLPALFILTELLGARLLPQARIPAGMAWLLGAMTAVPLLLVLYGVSILRCNRLLGVKGS